MTQESELWFSRTQLFLFSFLFFWNFYSIFVHLCNYYYFFPFRPILENFYFTFTIKYCVRVCFQNWKPLSWQGLTSVKNSFRRKILSITSDFRCWRYTYYHGKQNEKKPFFWLSIDKRQILNGMIECYESQSDKQTSSDSLMFTFLLDFFSFFLLFFRLCF